MAKIRTWKQAVDYTFKTRHTWRTGSGKQPAMINTAHFTRLRGASFPVDKITRPEMSSVEIELEEEGKSDGTINRVVSAVSTVLNHCASDDLIPSPPRFRRRKEGEGRTLFFTKDEVDRLADIALTVFHRKDLADITLIAAYTGARQGELLKLKRKDIDFRLNTIFIGGRPEAVTKAKNFRSVPIHNRIGRVLHTRVDELASEDLVFGCDWRARDQLIRAFRKVVRLIDKDDNYVFHCLRHSFGTWAVEAGVPIRTIMDLMGHKRIETTLRYAKTTDRARSEAIASI